MVLSVLLFWLISSVEVAVMSLGEMMQVVLTELEMHI